MRGIVSLAAALALPLTRADGTPLPYRAELILLTFIVIVVTLVVQGLTPGPADPRSPPAGGHASRAGGGARAGAYRGGRARSASRRCRAWRATTRWRTCGRRITIGSSAIAELRAGVPRSSSLAEAAFKRARHETLAAERRALIELRDRGEISDEVLLALEEELDREALRHGLAHVRPNQ